VVASAQGSQFRQGIYETFRNQRMYREGFYPEHGRHMKYLPCAPLKKGILELVVVGDGDIPVFDIAPGTPMKVKCLGVPKAPVPCSGHNTREPGIINSSGQFIVLTNDDNYYVSGFVSRLADEITSNPSDIYAWNCVHNAWAWQGPRVGISRGRIDLGCVAVRMEIAVQVGFPWRSYDGDFDYIEACMNLSGRTIRFIDEILSVHN
jgi:hypothetical protein